MKLFITLIFSLFFYILYVSLCGGEKNRGELEIRQVSMFAATGVLFLVKLCELTNDIILF